MANRNSELHFKHIPQLDIKRSVFDLSHGHKTTMNEGELTPILVQEILPGDTFSIDTGYVLRMNTPLKPVMDTAYLDLYFFFVPNRLAWEHWPEFMGENKTGAWDEEIPEYQIPGTYGQFSSGTIADKMGIPTLKPIPEEDAVNVIPFRDYVLIYNEWFRNQNLIAPIDTERDIDSVQENNTGSPCVGNVKPLKVAKLHDYFTSGLPGPQKGDPVQLPLGDSAPVIGNGNAMILETFAGNKKTNSIMINDQYYNTSNNKSSISAAIFNVTKNGMAYGTIDKPIPLGNDNVTRQDGTDIPIEITGSGENLKIGGKGLSVFGLSSNPNTSGLIADLTNATAININDIRLAFAVQRQLEKDARGGTRYIEIIKSNFGVTSDDARQQRPEYLGGKRCPINMMQVLQTSEGTETSPQGNTAAFSNTTGSNRSVTKSFTEHGFIIGLACIRVVNSYQNGINRMWSRKGRFDYYWPALANIGEQPILNKEIFVQNNTTINNEAFGYQEAWAEYRYNQNLITGQLRSNAGKNGNIWHYGLNFESLPTLSQEFNDEDAAAIDQTLSVSSEVSDQFTCDLWFNIKAGRPMPMYSVPGLIDHN